MPAPRCPDCAAQLVSHCVHATSTSCDWWRCPVYGGYGYLDTNEFGQLRAWVHDVEVVDMKRERWGAV